MTLLRALHCLNSENVSFECVHIKEILCLCTCFSFQLCSVFSKTNRIKNRPLIIIEPQAHKKLNPSLSISILKSCKPKLFCSLDDRADFCTV